MKIAIAQIKSTQIKLARSIKRHIEFIKWAASKNVNAIFFPELSLTGYEPAMAKKHQIMDGEPLLTDLEYTADKFNIIIGVGAPTYTPNKPQISMLIFKPRLKLDKYSKIFLHEDELPFFVSGDNYYSINIADAQLGIGICYESLQDEHVKYHKEVGTKIYIASVAKAKKDMQKAKIRYAQLASKYAMNILMCNCLGYHDNFEAGGESGIWNHEGHHLASLNDKDEGILIYDVDEQVAQAIYL